MKDEKNNPIEFIEIQLQNKDSIIFKSELTNAEGKFILETEKGEYSLLIRQLGVIYHKQKLNVNDDTHIGIIKIAEKKKQLQEVVITSKKKLIERKVDRLIFNVENSISAGGGDVIDALKITPRVKVKNDNISIIGKSGVSVMIDNKIIQLTGDDLLNYLKSISSDNIRNIEIITTPPSKYDAEGNSGILNINLKKAKNNNWALVLRETFKQGKYASNTFGSYFSYQKNKVRLLFDISKQDNNNIYTNSIKYIYPNKKWENEIYNKTNSKNYSSLINFDYMITKKTNISLQYLGNFNNPLTTEDNSTKIFDNSLIETNQLISVGSNNKKIKNQSISFNFITRLDTIGKTFSFDVDYFRYNSNKKNIFKTEKTNFISSQILNELINNYNDQSIENFSSKFDLDIPNNFLNLSFGSKFSFTKTKNYLEGTFYNIISGEQQLNFNQFDDFTYKENIQSFYLSSNKKLNHKWEMQAGLRVEFTQNKSISFSINDETKREYYKIFPTLYITYQANENNKFSINYSRRINRPSYSNLNPAKWYLNSNSYEEGNPFLQPSFSDNLEFSHIYKELLSTTISLSNTNNGFGQLTIHDEINNIQKFIRQNYYNSLFLGLDESVNFNVSKCWESVLNYSLYYSQSKTSSEILESNYSGWSSDFSAINNFKFGKKISAQFIYEYSFPRKYVESTFSDYHNLNLGVKYSSLNKKFILSLNLNNILKSDRVLMSSKSSNIFQSFYQYYDTQFFRLSIVYKFGSELKKIEKRELSNQDEKNRIN
ncbi:hypothetical protein BWK62_02150 [Flavobacterium oreochromis]|uniref:Outer membrane protein beta-barrel domain-containing protein n=1 Tax=Flavobacterium columnare TaxID=996 RepID=A0A2D0AI81_9FLAO|nr:hypothetical protein BWG23_12940 [Flavobacterium oreochromis]OWP79523.1 hypothetical protein BWK62_02150 [Flavobacterium oreochromis]